uniref:DUF4209 domain-containing protein n=1 Tax=Rhodnius prolixus TaxID=13249 RepID=T1I160_RHOPR
MTLPLMEHMMRSIYCESNNCLPNKMLAETSEFYITLDVMLEKKYGAIANNFIDVIGENILLMLLDLFSYRQGPRLRDRVSHFEIEIKDFPKELANYTIVLCLCIIQHLMPEVVNKNQEIIQIGRLTEVINKYEPIFHPTSLWKRQVLCILNKMNEWSGLPRPPEFKQFSLWSKNENFKLVESLLEVVMIKRYLSADAILQELIEDAKELKYPTIFRPPKEIEIVYLFSRINNAIEEIHNNINANVHLRYNLWNSRQMRSRQRENYGRMLEYVYLLQIFLICILNLQIKIVRGLLELNEKQIIFFIK